MDRSSDPDPTMHSDYPTSPVPFTRVKISAGLWRSRLETNTAVTVPYTLDRCEDTGRISNFAKAANVLAGTPAGGKHEGMRYNDSDLFKVLEGAAYTLSVAPDPELDRRVDHVISQIAKAQESDGYLYTLRTIHPHQPGKDAGDERWVYLAMSHELYNVGHMYEAAVAHFHATGKRTFLNVALKNADLLVRTFGPDGIRDVPGHQEIEIGLVKLYRTTGRREYLDLATYFLDMRGRVRQQWIGRKPIDPRYMQNHAPVVEQSEAVGHSVRALYMYSGMADVAAITGTREYIDAIDRIWSDVVETKLYITGGVGARHDYEAFGAPYELPNKTAYNETCAAIGMMLWSHRMFLLHERAEFFDVFERTLHNGFLAGVELSGERFFYPNPLEADGRWGFNHGATEREPWFDCSCCPTNVVRFMPSLPGYVYAVKDGTLFVNLYTASESTVDVDAKAVTLVQETNYPWSGTVRLSVRPEVVHEFELALRVPSWTRGRPVPSALYGYVGESDRSQETSSAQFGVRVNGGDLSSAHGTSSPARVGADGYLRINRTWERGDTVEIVVSMPIRRVVADDRVEENRGKVCIERGPVVYCFEEVDNGDRLDAPLADHVAFTPTERPDMLGGVTVLTSDGRTAIPYYAWNHRGPGRMKVWMERR